MARIASLRPERVTIVHLEHGRALIDTRRERRNRVTISEQSPGSRRVKQWALVDSSPRLREHLTRRLAAARGESVRADRRGDRRGRGVRSLHPAAAAVLGCDVGGAHRGSARRRADLCGGCSSDARDHRPHTERRGVAVDRADGTGTACTPTTRSRTSSGATCTAPTGLSMSGRPPRLATRSDCTLRRSSRLPASSAGERLSFVAACSSARKAHPRLTFRGRSSSTRGRTM
jgi:hypothetical protein